MSVKTQDCCHAPHSVGAHAGDAHTPLCNVRSSLQPPPTGPPPRTCLLLCVRASGATSRGIRPERTPCSRLELGPGKHCVHCARYDVLCVVSPRRTTPVYMCGIQTYTTYQPLMQCAAAAPLFQAWKRSPAPPIRRIPLAAEFSVATVGTNAEAATRRRDLRRWRAGQANHNFDDSLC